MTESKEVLSNSFSCDNSPSILPRCRRQPGEPTPFFSGYVNKLTTTREDMRTWADVLELDDYCTFGGQA